MKETTLCITVSDDLQSIILPPYGVTFGVSGDVNVNEICMKLPKECKGFNLIRFVPRINYVNPNGDAYYYETVMESDESNCFFTWPITPDITAYTGHVRFSLTLYQTEGDNILHKFNTRSATGRVYTGFEAEKQVTPEQQQTLLGKLETQIKADLNDHTERLKDQLTEKGKEILDGFGESGNVSEELKTIKQDLGTKLTAPPTPEPGKILKIRSVNEDGTFVCEWADDGGSNLDVRIDGKSIVQDGVAEIPAHKGRQTRNNFGTVIMGVDGDVTAYRNTSGVIGYRYLPLNSIDMAVKAAMCDGKGAAWTAEEQAAARERMGVGEYEDILDVTLEEDCVLNLDLNGSFRHLYAHINQSNVTDPVIGTFYVMPRDKDGKRTLYAYGPSTSTAFKNIAGIWSYYGTMACRQMIVTNEQRETTGQIFNTLKVWDKNNYPGFPNSPFAGFMSTTTFKSGTRITIKGVRA